MRVSIIVPVFNAEAFLPACIESVLCQRYTDYELILVNDGSEDTSGDICDRYAALYPQIKAVHSKNSGPGAARNLGLSNASGEYIQFLDSDDKISADCLKVFAKNAEESHADVLIAGVSYRNGQDEEARISVFPENRCQDIREALAALQLKERSIFLNYLWNKWYRRSLIVEKNICFDETLRLGEDFFWNCDIYRVSKTVHTIDSISTYYYKRENGSLSGKFNPCELERRRKMDKKLLELYAACQLDTQCRDLLDVFMGQWAEYSITTVKWAGSYVTNKERKAYVAGFLNSEYGEYLKKACPVSKAPTGHQKMKRWCLHHKATGLFLLLFDLQQVMKRFGRSGKK